MDDVFGNGPGSVGALLGHLSGKCAGRASDTRSQTPGERPSAGVSGPRGCPERQACPAAGDAAGRICGSRPTLLRNNRPPPHHAPGNESMEVLMKLSGLPGPLIMTAGLGILVSGSPQMATVGICLMVCGYAVMSIAGLVNEHEREVSSLQREIWDFGSKLNALERQVEDNRRDQYKAERRAYLRGSGESS
ncbi:hypothetical protein [Rhodovarius lipocyclicus]|uniref:hypothetical protein n=1 Tax=Rhodovarius lipocyclicus TaxID=268410 RepID=UPI00135A88D8|nr:hypothetical protein [Rhodovarius lipocyclicus]